MFVAKIPLLEEERRELLEWGLWWILKIQRRSTKAIADQFWEVRRLGGLHYNVGWNPAGSAVTLWRELELAELRHEDLLRELREDRPLLSALRATCWLEEWPEEEEA